MIRRVATTEVAALWPSLRPLIARGLAQTAEMTSEEQLRAGLDAEVLQLWVKLDASAPLVAITMVGEYPTLRVLSVVLLAGTRMPVWLEALEAAFDAFGRERGCTALEALVRPGLVGAQFRPARAVLKNWRPEKTLIRRLIEP